MVLHLCYYQLALLALIWLFVRLHLGWPRRSAAPPPTPGTLIKPKRKRATEPQTFEGLTHKPSCARCEQDSGETNPAPPVRPDPRPSTNRRPRTVETSMHFWPHTDCAYRGWLGLNNLRAHGHVAAGHRCGDAYAGDGAAGGASGRPALGTGLRPALFNRWTPGLRHGMLGPFWPVEATGPASRQRPDASTTLGLPP